MKRIFEILVSIVCLSICYESNAQNDVYLVSDPQNARWSYIETDSNGKHILTTYYSIDSIEGDGVNGSIRMSLEEVEAASPKDTIKDFMFYRFKDGEFMVDVSAGIEYNIFEDKLDSIVCNTIKEKYPDLTEEQKKEVLEKTKSEFIKTSGEIRGIPRYPKVGKLPDYEFTYKVSIMGIKVRGQERRIVGTERIQTKAGAFDCLDPKIKKEYRIEINDISNINLVIASAVLIDEFLDKTMLNTK